MGTTAIMGLRRVGLLFVVCCVGGSSSHATDNDLLSFQIEAVLTYAEPCRFEVDEKRVSEMVSDAPIAERIARAFGYPAQEEPPIEVDPRGLAVVCSALLRSFGPSGVVAPNLVQAREELDRQMTGATEVPMALWPHRVKTVPVGPDGKLLSGSR